MEIEWKNRKRERAGKPLLQPLYTAQDARDSLKYFESVAYGERMKIDEGIEVCFVDAGHLLGSSFIKIWSDEGENRIKAVFSGDIGNNDKPIINDPTFIEDADYVVMESTYGGRNHENVGNSQQLLCDIIADTFAKGGNVVIPSFAVGRTQELIYELSDIVKKKMIPQLDKIPVYVDSPLGIEATNIYRRNKLAYFDEGIMARIKAGDNPFEFDSLYYYTSVEDSKSINFIEQPKVIISSSGMCEAGRIKHHLKHNLWREDSTILFSGYQAAGTLGRRILEGADTVKIFGEEISVHARIETMEGFSSHADRAGLLRWLGAFKKRPTAVFLVHGEESNMQDLNNAIQENGYRVYMPYLGDMFDTRRNALQSYDGLPRRQYLDYAQAIKDRLEGQAKYLEEALYDCRMMLKRCDLKDIQKLKPAIDEIDSLLEMFKGIKDDK
jgi:metallo-beta-lactamase family protein